MISARRNTRVVKVAIRAISHPAMPALSLLVFVGDLVSVLPLSFSLIDILGSPGVGVSIGATVLETDRDFVGCGNTELDAVSATSSSATR